jgi:hypothetical protein
MLIEVSETAAAAILAEKYLRTIVKDFSARYPRVVRTPNLDLFGKPNEERHWYLQVSYLDRRGAKCGGKEYSLGNAQTLQEAIAFMAEATHTLIHE